MANPEGQRGNYSLAITRLTEKLGEIVGLDAVKDFNAGRNERGELVNEEGLPIIDITEPEPVTEDGSFVPYPDPIFKLEQVSAPVRDRLREKRDSILDALEQEERNEEERERQQEREELAASARKRAEASQNEKERQNNAKELQKKMGKALLRNITESKEQAERAKLELKVRDELEEARRKAASPSKKKNVTFADEPELFSPDKEKEEWGDLTPGRIQPMKRPSLLSETAAKPTMQMNVVERRPTRPVSPPRPTQPERDSDDESDDGLLESHDASSPPDSGPESDNELDEETDFDFAALQRQVQLEYHRKRAVIGQDAASLIQSSSEPDPDAPNPDDTAGITKGDTSKPAISQYRASRLLSAYGATTPSGAASDFIVPAASARTLQTAIRTGKLDEDGKLVGGEDDSASEAEDETMQEVLELLKKGEVYNLGPNGEPIAALPADPSAAPASSSTSKATPTAAALGLTSESKKLPPLATKAPMSKFKLARGAGGRTPEGTETTTPASESATPVNDLARSSPKEVGTPPTAISTPLPTGMPSMIVDSPSFAPPAGAASSSAAPPSHPAFSMIVESPSSPRPGSTPKAQPSSNAPPLPAGPLPGQVVERKTARPTRPPTLISSTVKESRPVQEKPSAPADSPSEPPKKVSRFKRDRMQ
ncbi:hypothetical protein D9611_004968 [Ephemerocybe angulata]|uniref:DUF3835 domain-containing protein n=1 Tax=Ephemerocybe angulata TaxID=980116 RepID=A0A8H5EXQ7_9AGAR|nr:hypothetical protein D9611_004968 [Tulosesus angulatus]